jgi:tRNA/rRNA methyltransferase
MRIILVEPAGALNVGSVARVMKNMGLSELAIVNPRCDIGGAEAKQMAVHAADILANSKVFGDLPTALTGCDRVVATSARERHLPTEFASPNSAIDWLLAGQQGAIIFGREDSGLTNVELNYAQRFLRIPVAPVYESLNLAQAVAICCYEVFLAKNSLKDDRRNQDPGEITNPAAISATREVLEGYYNHLESTLLQMGYLYPHTAESRMMKFRRIFDRADLSPDEVTMLRGILSQMQWHLKNRQ